MYQKQKNIFRIFLGLFAFSFLIFGGGDFVFAQEETEEIFSRAYGELDEKEKQKYLKLARKYVKQMETGELNVDEFQKTVRNRKLVKRAAGKEREVIQKAEKSYDECQQKLKELEQLFEADKISERDWLAKSDEVRSECVEEVEELMQKSPILRKREEPFYPPIKERATSEEDEWHLIGNIATPFWVIPGWLALGALVLLLFLQWLYHYYRKKKKP